MAKKTNRQKRIIHQGYPGQEPILAIELSDQVVNCLEVWQDFLDVIPNSAKLPSFPVRSMEFGATYPYNTDSLYKIPMRQLRKERGKFGTSLNYWYRKDVLKNVPNYARGKSRIFPQWKQSFIKSNRAFHKDNKSYLSP